MYEVMYVGKKGEGEGRSETHFSIDGATPLADLRGREENNSRNLYTLTSCPATLPAELILCPCTFSSLCQSLPSPSLVLIPEETVLVLS